MELLWIACQASNFIFTTVNVGTALVNVDDRLSGVLRPAKGQNRGMQINFFWAW